MRPGPSRVVLSCGQNGGGRGGIDNAPGEEEVPMPQVERIERVETLCTFARMPTNAHARTHTHTL